MDCLQVKELLPEYVENSLGPSTKNQIDKHLSICQECSTELHELKNYLRAMSSLGEINAPADFLEKVHRRIEQVSAWRKLYEKAFIPLRIKVPLELAGVAIAALLVVFLHQGMSPEKKVPVEPWISQAPHPTATRPTKSRAQQIISDEPEAPKPAAPSGSAGVKVKIRLSLLASRELQTYGEKSSIQDSTTAAVPRPEAANSRSNVAARYLQQDEPLTERTAGAASSQETSASLDVGGPEAARDKQYSTAHTPDPIAIILRHVQTAGGRVSSIENQPGSDELDIVIVEIPTSNYDSFLKGLRQIGEVSPLEGSASIKDSDVIRLRIDLAYPGQSR